jgi:hypothetical protein
VNFLSYSIFLFKVTTVKPATVGNHMSTLRPSLKTESPSLQLNQIGARIGQKSKNWNQSESLSARLWNIDFLTLVELSVQGLSIGQSIKNFIEEKLNGRKINVCIFKFFIF